MPAPEHVLPTSGPQPELFGTYLNEHLAGAAGGKALSRRLADSHRHTAAASALAWLAAQVAEDRTTLIQLMSRLGIARTMCKGPFALLAERAGRLKPNCRLRGRSPLSSLIELEGMALGISGKASGWRTLRALAETDVRLAPFMLDELIERARQQADQVERLRIRAVVEGLAAPHG